MSQSNLINNEMIEAHKEKFLTCPIDLELLDDPMQGPCGHVFCRKCIQKWLDKKESCPICQSPIKFSQLYSTLLIRQILEENYVSSAKPTRKRRDPFKIFREKYYEIKNKAIVNRWDLKAIILFMGTLGFILISKNSSNRQKEYFNIDQSSGIIIWTFFLIILLNYLGRY